MRFCVLHRNSRWPPKMAGKRFLEILASRLQIPWGQKFHRNCSIAHHFRDKCVFVFYAEIQDGHKKWQENDSWEKSPVVTADILRIKNFVEIALSRIISKIKALLHFTEKFKMASKNCGKRFFGKSCQYTLQTP